MTLADRLRAVRLDTTPLRESRDFRLLFVAGTVFYLGSMVAYVLARYEFPGKRFVDLLVDLPIVLPPSRSRLRK